MQITFTQNDIHFILKCRVTICQIYFFSQYHSNNHYTVAKCMHVAKMENTTENGSK